MTGTQTPDPGPQHTCPASAARLEQHAELDDAGTVFAAQGRTGDIAHLVAGEDMTPDLPYVGMTRGVAADVAARYEARAAYIAEIELGS